jgi:hypothetical protein
MLCHCCWCHIHDYFSLTYICFRPLEIMEMKSSAWNARLHSKIEIIIPFCFQPSKLQRHQSNTNAVRINQIVWEATGCEASAGNYTWGNRHVKEICSYPPESTLHNAVHIGLSLSAKWYRSFNMIYWPQNIKLKIRTTSDHGNWIQSCSKEFQLTLTWGPKAATDWANPYPKLFGSPFKRITHHLGEHPL